jgi:type II secretory pathway component GspD/PulD (secretin)
MALIRSGLAITFLFAAQAWAQGALEIIPLKHRTVDQVLPVLRPLLDPGATLTGQSNQLIVRTSPENLAELRRALDAIDRPARRLQILVRFDGAQESSSRDVSGSGVISNRGSRIELRAQDSGTGEYERIDQRVQVVEGGEAWIATGESRPLPQRQRIQTPAGVVTQETFVVQEASTGFAVVPRLSGRTVQLDIRSQREALGPGGTLQAQRAATSASGRLGEWFELGSLAATGARDERSIGSSARTSGNESRRVWVKVEELPERRN